jgi:hypothetical protein
VGRGGSDGGAREMRHAPGGREGVTGERAKREWIGENETLAPLYIRW